MVGNLKSMGMVAVCYGSRASATSAILLKQVIRFENQRMDLPHSQRVRMLYKTILKLHRGLPADLQVMGTAYARDEFKRHKTCNIAEASAFMVEWAKYAVTLAQQLGLKGPKYAKKLGENLDNGRLDQLREDQITQLYELFLAAKEYHKEDEDNKIS